jgi:DNA-binding transcriptional ArsR family regulator
MTWRNRDDLSDTEVAILEMLADGRCTPAFIADEIDRSQEYVRERLGELRRLGLVESPYRGLYELAAGQEHDTDTRDRGRETTPAPEADADPYADLEFPQGVAREPAIGAIEAAVAYLRAEGGASMRELVREVMPEHDLGYEVPELASGERYRGSWWRKVVKPGLEATDAVAKPKPGGSEWRWVGKSSDSR